MRTIACLNWKGGSGKSTTAGGASPSGSPAASPNVNGSCWSTTTRKRTRP